jgi:hypothetical protein
VSTPPSPPPPPGARPPVEELLALLVQHDVEEAAAMPEAERDAELAKAGYDQARLDGAIEAALKAAGLPSLTEGAPAATAQEGKPPAAKVVDLGAARARRQAATRWTPLLAAAAAAVVIGTGGEETLTRWRPIPVAYPTYVPPPTAHEVADRVRAQALGLCKRRYYGECLDLLDQARDADPAGDAAPEVQAARAEIALRGQLNTDDPGQRLYSKPGVGPGEVPLRRSPKGSTP